MVMGGKGAGTLLTIYNNLDIVGMFATIFTLFLSFGIY